MIDALTKAMRETWQRMIRKRDGQRGPERGTAPPQSAAASPPEYTQLVILDTVTGLEIKFPPMHDPYGIEAAFVDRVVSLYNQRLDRDVAKMLDDIGCAGRRPEVFLPDGRRFLWPAKSHDDSGTPQERKK